MGTVACPASLGSALLIRVKDAQTDAYIASGATLRASYAGAPSSGNVMPPFGPGADSLPFAVLGSAGTYGIAVSRPGYSDFVQNGIVVAADGACQSARTVRLTVKLVPAP
jgi:hypothetical protein